MSSRAPSRPDRPTRDVATTRLTRRRDVVAVVLGLVWLLDGGLQFQPFMYTAAFPAALANSGAGSPGWISGPVTSSSTLLAHHLTLFNTAAAVLQVAIGVGVIWRRSRRPALVASVLWGLAVWWLGEGLGTMFAGPVSPLLGLPGAVVLYVLVAALVWPRPVTGAARSLAAGSPLGALGAGAAWVALWLLFAWETLRAANRAPQALHDAIAATATGEPAWVKAVDRVAADVLDHRGTVVSIVLAVVFVAVAAAVVVPARAARVLLALAVVVAVVIWVVGEDFGALATGSATDPNSGPLLALLACCYWPLRRPQPDPAR